MLIQVTAKSISGRKLTGTTQSICVNPSNMFGWKDVGADSTFFYVVNPNDRQDKALVITIDEAISAKLAAANTANGDRIVKLPTETTIGGDVTDIYVPNEAITWVELAEDEVDHVRVSYNEGGFKTRTVTVPFSLLDMTYVASTGTSSS